MKNSSIVTIGSGTTTYGTGLLISYCTKKYILTVGHVIRVSKSENPQLWAITDPKMTLSPPGGYHVILINNIHLDDNDLAICELIYTPKLEEFPFIPFDNMPVCDLQPGDRIRLVGYPDFYVGEKVALNRLEPLLPFEMKGTIKKVNNSLILMNLHGSPIKVKEVIVAYMEECIKSSGLSGGIVLRGEKIAGILIGQSDQDYSELVFVTTSKIIVLLNSIRRLDLMKKLYPCLSETGSSCQEILPIQRFN